MSEQTGPRPINVDSYYGSLLRFENLNCSEGGVEVTVSFLADAERIILWYYSFCAGDNITTYIDNIQVYPDANGRVNLVSEIA